MTVRSIASGRLAATLCVVALALACAVDEPPPGGPEDKDPPRVLTTVPAADSAGVSPDADIVLEFSEDMTRTGFPGAIEVFPEVKFKKVKWRGNKLVLTPLDPLNPDTTYVVRMKAGVQDFHRVATSNVFTFAFATSAVIDTGYVEGTVYFRREPTGKAVVKCFVLPKDSSFTPESARADREARTDGSGEFRLSYLPRGREMLIWAFEDANNNGRFDPDNEAGARLTDTVTLLESMPSMSNREIWIVDPKEPATVSGKVSNETGVDTLAVSVGWYRIDADTVAVKPAYYTRCDTLGEYRTEMLMGTYLMRAFLDFAADSLCGTYPCGPDSSAVCTEPCVVHPDTLRVEPGKEIEMSPLVLPAGGGE